MALVNQDVVEHILDSYDHWWPRDLCRLALICSVWSHPSRRRLYACPTLSSYRSCHHLARTLEENPSLVPFVRALDIRPSPESSWPHGEDDECTAGYLLGVPRLLALSRLERLTLGGDLASSSERLLRGVASPQTIKALRVINPKSGNSCSARDTILNWDGELSLRFHALEAFSLDGPLVLDIEDAHYGLEIDNVYGTHSAGGCRLKELHLRNVELAMESGSICALLHAPASWQHLCALTYEVQHRTIFDIEGFASLLRYSHESLERLVLRVSAKAEGYPDVLLECMKRVPTLSNLRMLETPHEFLQEELCPIVANVEVLDVVGKFDVSHLLEWSEHIKANGFPKLRKFLLCLRNSPTRRLSLSHIAFRSLAGSCEGHGIEFFATC